jgi:hypothetical protein
MSGIDRRLLPSDVMTEGVAVPWQLRPLLQAFVYPQLLLGEAHVPEDLPPECLAAPDCVRRGLVQGTVGAPLLEPDAPTYRTHRTEVSPSRGVPARGQAANIPSQSLTCSA